MDFEAISGAASVAVLLSILFWAMARIVGPLGKMLDPGQRFPDNVMREAGQRYRDRCAALRYRQATNLAAAFVFIMLFVTAYSLDVAILFAGYPRWQLLVVLTVVVAAAGYAVYRVAQNVGESLWLRLNRDANIAVGHQLQQHATGIGHVFHDVGTSAGVVDHVVVGQAGVYAVHVFAKRPAAGGAVVVEQSRLAFLPSGKSVSLVSTRAKNVRLEKQFSALVGQRVRVRSVLAVPGWQIQGQPDDEYLVVNETSLPMLRGWKDAEDYLMNEDVETLATALRKECRLHGRFAGVVPA